MQAARSCARACSALSRGAAACKVALLRWQGTDVLMIVPRTANWQVLGPSLMHQRTTAHNCHAADPGHICRDCQPLQHSLCIKDQTNPACFGALVRMVQVSGGQATTYKLAVAPTRSGVQLGTLTFKTAEGQAVWYSVEVRASEPPEVGGPVLLLWNQGVACTTCFVLVLFLLGWGCCTQPVQGGCTGSSSSSWCS